MRSRALALLAAGALGLSAPGMDAGDEGAVTMPSVVEAVLVGGPGPALVELTAWSGGVHVDGAAPTAVACLSSERRHRWSEQRDGWTVHLRSVATTSGCGATERYGFDHFDWRATVLASVATHVETVTSELRDGTRVEVRRTRASGPVTSLRGTWTGRGATATDPSLVPRICYSWPPAPCSWWRPGLAASSAADVAGAVTFAGAEPMEIATTGTMRWRTP